MKNILAKLLDLISLSFTPFVAAISTIQSKIGSNRLPLTYRTLDHFKVTPVTHHYYQPVFNPGELPESTWAKRDPLYGIDLNTQEQLVLLNSFQYNSELAAIPLEQPVKSLDFFYNNPSFNPGDAETLYNVVRHFKPKRIIEIGSGYSTRLMKKALDKNRSDGSSSIHICIEPYEMPWLESLGIDRLIRAKVEDVDLSLFSELKENDILFIDSSHVLRSAGDVFVEYLHILPCLNKGVIIHIHDIFLPFEYPKEWVVNQRKFFTEQYLLQAFLAFNSEFEILLACNYLSHDYPNEFSAKNPIYADKLNYNPGSFWLRRKKSLDNESVYSLGGMNTLEYRD